MPMYDRICDDGHIMIDCWEKINTSDIQCSECGKATKRAWLTKVNSVIQDSIEGGIWIRHGLCNPDGSPRRYYSHTEIRKEAERRGLRNIVEHVPGRDSDKNKHTTRWI
jgi:hypothetical protein